MHPALFPSLSEVAELRFKAVNEHLLSRVGRMHFLINEVETLLFVHMIKFFVVLIV